MVRISNSYCNFVAKDYGDDMKTFIKKFFEKEQRK